MPRHKLTRRAIAKANVGSRVIACRYQLAAWSNTSGLVELSASRSSNSPFRKKSYASASLVGAALSLFVALGYLVAKLLFWNRFELGIAPVLIGFFFISSVQLFFVGIVDLGKSPPIVQHRQCLRPCVALRRAPGCGAA